MKKVMRAFALCAVFAAPALFAGCNNAAGGSDEAHGDAVHGGAIMCTADTVASTISNLSDGEHTVKVTGGITGETISSVANALERLGSASPEAKVRLDLSDATGLTGIDDHAFDSDKHDYSCLVGINLPNVEQIGYAAFYGCTSLVEVTIPNSVRDIGESAFENTGLTSVVIPGSLAGRSMGVRVFSDCASLTSVVIEPGVTYIGSYAFSACTSLTSVSMPDSVTDIDDCAFCDCTSLTEMTIPAGVTTIGQSVFDGCTSLERVIFSEPTNWMDGNSTSADVSNPEDNAQKLKKWQAGEWSDGMSRGKG